MKRRNFIGTSAAASVGFLTTSAAMANNNKVAQPDKLKYNINHSVCYWCYGTIPFEDFLKNLVELDLRSIDLVGPEEFPLLKKYNIHASMCWGAGLGIEKGWNDLSLHEELIKDYERVIPLVAEAGYTNLICFSGNRNGMDGQCELGSSISRCPEEYCRPHFHKPQPLNKAVGLKYDRKLWISFAGENLRRC